jgi:ribose-phosphate pyrophosphokinase
MVRGLPTLFATRSGRNLGEKVAAELSGIMCSRIHSITDAQETARLEKERARIEEIRERNRELFGDKWGKFHLRHSSISNFSDGEIHFVVPNYRINENGPVISNSVRGQDVFLIHSPYESRKSIDDLTQSLPETPKLEDFTELLTRVRAERSIHDNLIEGWILAYTLGHWAEKVTVVQPNHLYARQDHSREREAAIAKMIAEFSDVSRVDHAIFLDLHSDQITGFYGRAADNLHASSLIIETIKEEAGYTESTKDDYVVMTPDAGGTARARYYAKKLDTEVAIGDKRRDYSAHNKVDRTVIIGEVKDKKVIVIDDMIDTAGTMCSVIEECVGQGAKEVYLACSHPIMSGPAISRLQNLYSKGKLKSVLVTDSISRGEKFSEKFPWYKEKSTAKMLASAIYQLTMEGSVGNVYESDSRTTVVNFKTHS